MNSGLRPARLVQDDAQSCAEPGARRRSSPGSHFILGRPPAAAARRLASLGGTTHHLRPTNTVKYEDLETAFDWSSSGAPFENTALLNRQTGEVFLKSMHGDFDEEFPEDIEDGSIFIAAPHKHDLNLGRELVLDFVEAVAPQHLSRVEAYFRHRGAYSKFKALLERESLLDGWYKYEADATRKALLRWASENGLHITGIPSAA